VGPVQKKDVVLASPPTDVTVLALPATGRPATFTGAVGHFDLSATTDASNARAGEPIELRLTVRGTGNLDRVSLAGLPSSADLETFAPTVTRTADSKTFVQAIVPRRAGSLPVPSIELAYFDPDRGEYVTTRTDPMVVDVRPGAALATTTEGRVPDATSGPVLAASSVDDGRSVASLRPIVARKTFWLAQLAPLALLAAAVSGVVVRRRLAADPRRKRRGAARRVLRKHRAEMDRAVGRSDAPAFFAAARGAVQQALGARWDVPPAAVTPAEIERRGSVLDLDTLRRLFEADAARFGVGVNESDLARWNTAVRRELTRAEEA